MSDPETKTARDEENAGFDLMQDRIESLSGKMDRLINIQQKVLYRLDGMSHDIDDIEKDMENLKVDKEEIHFPPRMMTQTQVMGREVKKICQEMTTIMSAVNQRSEQQAQKLDGMEKLVLGMQQVIGFIGETVKSSRIMELILKGPTARKVSKAKENKGKQAVKRKSSAEAITKKQDKKTTSNQTTKGTQQMKDHKVKDGTDKPCLSPQSQKAQKRMKPPDTADISTKKQVLLLEEIQNLNKENKKKSGYLDLEAGVPPADAQVNGSSCNLVNILREDLQAAEKHEVLERFIGEKKVEEKIPEGDAAVTEQEPTADVKEAKSEEKVEKVKEEEKKEEESTLGEGVKAPETPAAVESETERPDVSPPEQEKAEEVSCSSSSTKSFVTVEHFVVEDHTADLQQEVQENAGDSKGEEPKVESEGWAVLRAAGIELELNLAHGLKGEEDAKEEETEDIEHFFIDTTPPPPAPFNHRVVSAKPNQISNFYTINWQEILGGGRFGQVHKCVENSSGLTLAAKVIKARSPKEKEVVKTEIQVMNNLNHANLIQLYAAYESRNDIILVLEYVGGGELFDRIIDENDTLMELDAVTFIRQICDGLQHMHKMYILHLDLKPENILCVSRVTSKVKIIDFGLARVYKPREKLRVNFGTPEFLAPEVINYDFVSFNTDMWSLGVITYMLLSGLSPFLGDDDNETLNNILACQWNLEEQEFVDTSDEAKDFINRLLIVNKSWRMGAAEALKHPWLSDPALHHRLHTKKTMCRSRRSSCVPVTDS